MASGIVKKLREYRRIGAVLGTWPTLIILWLGILAMFLTTMVARLTHLPAAGMKIIDPPCGSPQCDFSLFWPAGLAARTGQAGIVYQQPAFLALRQHLFFPGVDPLPWLYPPPVLLPAVPVSWLPFETGFIVWTVGLTLAAILLLRLAKLPWLVIALAFISPAALWNYELGQLGVLTGSILAGGILLAEEKPLLSGAMLAMLAIKPQAAILLPVALLSGRKFRVIAAGIGAGAALLLVTLLAFGWPLWRGYLTAGLAVSRMVLQMPPLASGYAKFGVSVFWMLRYAGAGTGAAYLAQAIVTLVAAGLLWRLWRPSAIHRTARMALTVFLTLLAAPYGFTDDMVAWSIALAALAVRRGWRIDPLDVLFWLWPALCPIVTTKTGFLLSPVILTLAIIRTWRRAAAHLPVPSPVLPGTA